MRMEETQEANVDNGGGWMINSVGVRIIFFSV